MVRFKKNFDEKTRLLLRLGHIPTAAEAKTRKERYDAEVEAFRIECEKKEAQEAVDAKFLAARPAIEKLMALATEWREAKSSGLSFYTMVDENKTVGELVDEISAQIK